MKGMLDAWVPRLWLFIIRLYKDIECSWTYDAAGCSGEFTGHEVILCVYEIERGTERAGLRLLFEGNISTKMCKFKTFPADSV